MASSIANKQSIANQKEKKNLFELSSIWNVTMKYYTRGRRPWEYSVRRLVLGNPQVRFILLSAGDLKYFTRCGSSKCEKIEKREPMWLGD